LVASLTIQRLYAFAVLLLRDFFCWGPLDRLFQWKAQVTMSLSQVCLVGATVLSTSVAMGHLVWIAQSKGAFLGSGTVLGLVLYSANGWAEQRVLPRFEHEYRALTRPQRILGTIMVLLIVVLTAVAFFESAAAARGLR
jgi:hypothetical protein